MLQTITRSKILFASLFIIATNIAFTSITFAQSPGYHVLRTFHIASTNWWDYINVNHQLHRLYVSHGTQVNILDENTGDSVGVIPNTQGVHGIAFATPFGKGYTSDGGANMVTVFDLKTNKVLGTIPTGENPDAIMYDPYSKKIFTCNGKSHDGSVIDPATDKVVQTIPLGGKPETAVSDAAGKIYVNIESKNEVAEIDAKTFKITNRWPIGKGESPSGLSMDTKTHRLFIGCDNKLMIVMNALNGKVVAQLPIGEGCDGTDFDPGRKFAFSSNGEGTLTIIKEFSANDFKVVQNVITKRGARTSTVDIVNHKLFLPTAEFGPEPTATAEHPHPRPSMIPGSFQVLEVGN